MMLESHQTCDDPWLSSPSLVYSTWYSPSISMRSNAACDSPNDSMVTLYSKSRDASMSPLNAVQSVVPSVVMGSVKPIHTPCYHCFQFCCCFSVG